MAIYTKTALNTLALGSTVTKNSTRNVSASSALVLEGVQGWPIYYFVQPQYLTFVGVATANKPEYELEDTLTFSHSVEQETDLNLSTNNTISFVSKVSHYVQNAGTSDPVTRECTDATLIHRTTTVLTYPYVGPTITLELRNPDFDDVEQFEYRRINRRSRGGTLHLFADDDWPKAERLIMNFSSLSDQQSRDLLDFIQESLGKEIGLLDHENRQWKGIILTAPSPVSNEARGAFSTTLEFDGELV